MSITKKILHGFIIIDTQCNIWYKTNFNKSNKYEQLVNTLTHSEKWKNNEKYNFITDPDEKGELTKIYVQPLENNFNLFIFSSVQYSYNHINELIYEIEMSFTSKITNYDEILNKYNTPNYTLDKLDIVKSKVNEIASVMQNNISQVLNRDEKIDELKERSEKLNANASMFQSNSNKLKRNMRMRNIKYILGGILAGIIVIGFIVLIIVV
jgi:hypothetical protein